MEGLEHIIKGHPFSAGMARGSVVAPLAHARRVTAGGNVAG
jgi:hypothetical protein